MLLETPALPSFAYIACCYMQYPVQKSKLHFPPDRQSVNFCTSAEKASWYASKNPLNETQRWFLWKKIRSKDFNFFLKQSYQSSTWNWLLKFRGTCILNGTTLTQGSVSTCRNYDPYRTRCLPQRKVNEYLLDKYALHFGQWSAQCHM